MKLLFQPVAYVAILSIIVVSGCVNSWYGYNVGKPLSLFDVSGVDIHMGYLIALAGIAFDALKCVIPMWAISVFYGKSKTKTPFIVVAVLLWSVASFYSWQAASSAALLAKTKISGHSAEIIKQRQRLEDDLKEIKARNPWTAEIRDYKDKPASAIEELIAGKEAERAFQWSRQCTAATSSEERNFCRGYRALKEAQAVKIQVDSDAKEIDRLKGRIEKLSSSAPASADPISEAFAAETGWTPERVRARQSMYIGGAIELYANLGMAFLAWYLFLVPPVSRNKDDANEPGEISIVAQRPIIEPDNMLAVSYPRRHSGLEPLKAGANVDVEPVKTEEPTHQKPAPATLSDCEFEKPEPVVIKTTRIAAQRTLVPIKRERSGRPALVAVATVWTIDDIVRETFAVTDPGDYRVEELSAKCQAFAAKIKAKNPGAKLPQKLTFSAKRFVNHGAERLERPTGGDRAIRYRVHGDKMIQAA